MVSNNNECNHCPSVIDQSQQQPVTFIMDTTCSLSTAETFETFGSFFLRTAYRKIKNSRRNVGHLSVYTPGETAQGSVCRTQFCTTVNYIFQNDLLISIVQI